MDKTKRARRGFFGALLAAVLLAPAIAQARGRHKTSSKAKTSRHGGSHRGGSRGGCGSRGGAGYRKANGKCAGRNE